MEEKILELYYLAGNIPFIEHYSHTKCDMYKIKNIYTNYSEEKLVLCPVTDGFEKALDLALSQVEAKYKAWITNTSIEAKVTEVNNQSKQK